MRTRPRLLLLALLSLLALAGCGQRSVELADDDPDYHGAQIFAERCSGCHSLAAVGADGSASNVRDREYKDGPNFNQRSEEYEQILYAIRNGGFSSGPMPQNIVTGPEAEQVAKFLDKYSGKQAGRGQGGQGGRRPNPGNQAPTGSQ